MLCFVISKNDFTLSTSGKVDIRPKFVCIGSVISIKEAQSIANNFPCFTEVCTVSDTDKCCYIVCNI